MPFLPPNQQRQSTDGKKCLIQVFVKLICFYPGFFRSEYLAKRVVCCVITICWNNLVILITFLSALRYAGTVLTMTLLCVCSYPSCPIS